MKRFQELIVPCSADAATAIVNGITERIQQLPSDWEINQRAMENTRRDHGVFALPGPFIYVNCLAKKAMVAFLFRSESTRKGPGLWVSNIVPLESSQLSVEEYNTVLNQFSTEVVMPVLAKMQFTGQPETTSEDWEAADAMPKNCADLLNQFATMANKYSLHPYDEARWRQFVLAAWKSGQHVDEWNLCEILEKQYDFPSEQAMVLCDQFNFGIALLRESHE
jgi:hypothetical protein